jgi:hypothetical protein
LPTRLHLLLLVLLLLLIPLLIPVLPAQPLRVTVNHALSSDFGRSSREMFRQLIRFHRPRIQVE